MNRLHNMLQPPKHLLHHIKFATTMISAEVFGALRDGLKFCQTNSNQHIGIYIGSIPHNCHSSPHTTM
ncbi:hypothetical protein HYC85_011248 [Camellia sinensis]|uniref:Uncharacterized protein n=1 Tax=Camellia sinensis TaxID=4442 RepID=A0A7J7H9J9_CAMSI|nr:hypothetical protein HYC85_011248 [Camellia sinensis]